MIDLIKIAISKGAKIYSSVSGGKDGQAMTKALSNWGFAIEGLVHADLGRVEWPESLPACQRLGNEVKAPLHIIRRSDGADLLEHWRRRMVKLAGTGKPFWSSSNNRYCTSDLKRDPINVFLRNCGHDLIISCEGIRAEESSARAKKSPLEIRWRVTSKYYRGMTPEEAIVAYTPGKRLCLTWYPIFNFSLADVWSIYGMSTELLQEARMIYKTTSQVPAWWPFHPAYAYGNDRVSCMFCILGSLNDLMTGAAHNPELLQEMVAMEQQSGCTFKSGWALETLLPAA